MNGGTASRLYRHSLSPTTVTLGKRKTLISRHRNWSATDCTGTLGVLLTAKVQHLIPEVKKYLDRLSDQGFRLNERLYREVLEFAKE